MPNLQELKRQRAFALNKAEHFVQAAESAKREMTEAENEEYSLAISAVRNLSTEIDRMERRSTIRKHVVDGRLPLAPPGRTAGMVRTPDGPVVLSEDYQTDFFNWLGSGGQSIGAALYEGVGSSGGYAVPVVVDQQIVPLAPADLGVRSAATVIPTSSDIKIPRQTAFSTAHAKAEGDGTGSNLFTESEPTLDQFTLSAFMAGVEHLISWELAQDVPSFNSFAISDMLVAQELYEENLFITGSGSGQAQGLLGNVGAGVSGETADSNGNLLSIAATFDVMGTLKAQYHPGASFLMARATSIELRKAQTQSNLFEPVFTRENGRDYLHGYPVVYSTSMPAIAAGATPVLFGDFKQGYVIGDRGGSGINVKILDQPRATEGLIVLLAYRRMDGRVRRSEAIQGITLHT